MSEPRIIGVREIIANLLRIMRGGGYTDRLLVDIEGIAAATQATRGDYGVRSQALHDIVCDLHAWWPKHGDHPDVSEFERGVCDAALRIIAARLDGNSTQRIRALSDMLRHFRDRQERIELDAENERERRVDRMVAEMQHRHLMESRAAAATHSTLAAANDNAASYVYFITDGEAIKIGKANNPKSRLSGLQTSHHKPLRILMTIPGDEEVERGLHSIFGEFRIRGEWFKDCKDIRAFIRRHKDSAFNSASEIAA